MDDIRKNRWVAFAVWMVLQGYFVLLHFSWPNVLVLAVFAEYLMIAAIHSPEENGTIGTMGHFLGAGLGSLMGYYFVSAVIPVVKQYGTFLDFIFGPVLTKLRQLLMWAYDLHGWECGCLLASIIFFILQKIMNRHPIATVIFKYASMALLMFPLTMFFCPGRTAAWLYGLIAAVFAWCEIVIVQGSNLIWVSSAAGKWFMGLSICLNIMQLIHPDLLKPLTREGFAEYFFIICGFKWYTALLIAVVMMLAVGGLIIMENTDTIDELISVYLFLGSGCGIIVLYFMTRFYTGWWWILLGLYAAGNLCMMIWATSHEDTEENWADLFSVFAFGLPVLTVDIIALIIASHYGVLLPAFLAAAGLSGIFYAVLMYKFRIIRIPPLPRYSHLENDEQTITRYYDDHSRSRVCPYYRSGVPEDLDFFRFLRWNSTIILIWLWALGMSWLWMRHQLPYLFVLLSAVFAVCILFVNLLMFHSGFFYKEHHILYGIITAVVLLLVMSWSICTKGGCDIQVSHNENQELVIEATEKETGEPSRSVEYFWLDTFLFPRKDPASFPKEVKIYNPALPSKGRLRIVAADQNGIKTQKIVWLHSNPMAGTRQWFYPANQNPNRIGI